VRVWRRTAQNARTPSLEHPGDTLSILFQGIWWITDWYCNNFVSGADLVGAGTDVGGVRAFDGGRPKMHVQPLENILEVH
jgi:hypothetical protein